MQIISAIFVKKEKNMEKADDIIIIENPPKKALDFIMKHHDEKEELCKHLLEKKHHTFSIQI